jgi:UPF0042 nucleotide-binding protein
MSGVVSPSPAVGSRTQSDSSGRLVLVTGMSGAGRSTALKALEDLGYEAVDNLPLSLLDPLVAAGPAHPVAIGVDVRTRGFTVDSFLEWLRHAARPNCGVVFLDCDDELLRRRYTETRRRHPLAGDRPVIDGIRLERQRVSALRDQADLVIDTSALTAADLKRVLHGHFSLDAAPGVAVFVTSFSYRYGLPQDADLVFDVRFLDNPHYVPELRPLTGLDEQVGERIVADPGFAPFLARLEALLEPLLPRYAREGKSYLTIAVGCTGGRHRSVFVAERLADWLRTLGYRTSRNHRDLDRRSAASASAASIVSEPSGAH